MTKKNLDIKQCQSILIKMACEVRAICERHEIPLYMLGGTMLGAIRHKGFIPWDDDMDFGVPYERYYELMDYLDKELPSRFKAVTYENAKNMQAFFMKVEDKDTVVVDIRYDAPIDFQQGLTIDIFPLVRCKREDFEGVVHKIHNVYLLKRKIFIGSTDRKWYKLWVKRFLKFIVPFSSVDLNRKMKRLIDKMEPGDWICNISSPNFWNRPLPKEYFNPLKKYPFEDTYFFGITDYDSYLKELYKDYMKLPSKEKQIVHLDNVFYRNI